MKNNLMYFFILFFVSSTYAQSPKIGYLSPQTYSAGVAITSLSPFNKGGVPLKNGYTVSTFAGNGTPSCIDGYGVEAGFNYPMGVAVDSAGYVYVVDRHNYRICKISPSGKVVTLAGSGVSGHSDGKGTNASFNKPYGIDLDSHGNAYVADRYNNTIRKITPDGIVSTIAGSGAIGSADGIGTAASFYWPTGVAVDGFDNLIIADTYNNRIRKISPNGVVTTIAGSGIVGSKDGAALLATFNVPTGVEVDSSGNIWVADVNNNKIRKISTDSIVTTIAGNGSQSFADSIGTAAGFYYPYSLIMDPSGDFLVADANNNRIRKVTKTGVVTTIAGNGLEASVNGLPNASSFNYPADVAYDSVGNIFVADAENHQIRKIAPTFYMIFPTLPDGLIFDNCSGAISGKPLKGSPTTVYNIYSFNASGKDTAKLSLTILDTPVVRTVSVTSVLSNSVLANGIFTNVGCPYPSVYGFCWSKIGIPTVDSLKTDNRLDSSYNSFSTKITNLEMNTHYIVRAYAVNTLGTSYGDTIGFTTTGPAPNISYPVDKIICEVDSSISPVLLSNSGGSVLAYSKVKTLAGNGDYGSEDGLALSSSFNRPFSIAVGPLGDLYIADSKNNKIRQITPDGVVKTFAGSGLRGSNDGIGVSASFNYPLGVAVDKNGNVFVADGNNNKIRKVSKDGIVSTIAGSGSWGSADGKGVNATFNHPTGVVVDSLGNLFVCDLYNNRIRKITPDSIVSTFISYENLNSETIFYPMALSLDASGYLYVTEYNSSSVLKISPSGVVSTLAGGSNQGSIDGIGKNASFNYPTGITVDSKGVVWIADQDNNKIRRISATGEVTTVAGSGLLGTSDGTSDLATFNSPSGIAVDDNGLIYIVDQGSNKIRTFSIGKYEVKPSLPLGLNLDSETGAISGKPVRGASLTTYAVVATNMGGSDTATIVFAVRGKPTVSTISVSSITVKSAVVNGYIVDRGYPVATSYGVCWNKNGAPDIKDSVTYVEGCDAKGAFLCNLRNLDAGSIYYVRSFATNADGANYGDELQFSTPMLAPNIQYLSPQAYAVGTQMTPLIPVNTGGLPSAFLNVSTYCGNGQNSSVDGAVAIASFASPSSVATDTLGNVYIADASSNKIRKISKTGVVSTLAGNGLAGSVDGEASLASFNSPRGIAVDRDGVVYVADTYNHQIRKISKDGIVSTLAGNGVAGSTVGIGTVASFCYPTGLALDSIGNVYVADKSNHRICKISPLGVVTVLAGTGALGMLNGAGLNAQFNQPSGITVDKNGTVFVADCGNHMIRRITSSGIVTTLAGNGYSGQTNGAGASANFYYPIGLALDTLGNLIVAECGNNVIRMVTSAGVVSNYAGQFWMSGFLDGISTSAYFSYPTGVAIDNNGSVYIADYGNNRIRKITQACYSINPSLPSGLMFDQVTGVISGKPTITSSMKRYTIYSSNSGGVSNAELMFSIIPTGIDEHLTEVCTIFPNPASSQISIKGMEGSQRMSIFTLTGVKVLSQEVTNGEQVDVSKLKAGIYMVKIGNRELKLVKK